MERGSAGTWAASTLQMPPHTPLQQVASWLGWMQLAGLPTSTNFVCHSYAGVNPMITANAIAYMVAQGVADRFKRESSTAISYEE